VGIVTDPTHERFYGESNDRMPAFGTTMETDQIGILADWLRGEWYRPLGHGPVKAAGAAAVR
jgi:mono/diheme cytochrome c family protein